MVEIRIAATFMKQNFRILSQLLLRY
ncbi:hypothetical protein V12B01_12780 [Vibrio splendidus 12B01]|nr:hypothetical protein V12B01_12780 [Vibrio splendidus 12B01]